MKGQEQAGIVDVPSSGREARAVTLESCLASPRPELLNPLAEHSQIQQKGGILRAVLCCELCENWQMGRGNALYFITREGGRLELQNNLPQCWAPNTREMPKPQDKFPSVLASKSVPAPNLLGVRASAMALRAAELYYLPLTAWDEAVLLLPPSSSASVFCLRLLPPSSSASVSYCLHLLLPPSFFCSWLCSLSSPVSHDRCFLGTAMRRATPALPQKMIPPASAGQER